MTRTSRALSEEAAELLTKRAKAQAVAREEPVEQAYLSVGQFSLGGRRYAIPLAQLRAALPLRVTPVPLARREVLGVLRHDGEVIIAVSLASLLQDVAPLRDPRALVVVEVEGVRMALDFDEVPREARLPLDAVEAARRTSIGKAIVEVFVEGQVVGLLDLKTLLHGVAVG
jgi:chemotaxis signal transduction protein